MPEDLVDKMAFNKDGERKVPLFAERVNGKYIVAAYQGSLSEYDILIKYRQLENESWSRIRTPKHIHWAVDILIKMHENKEQTQSFLDFLVGVWVDTEPIRSTQARDQILDLEYLLEANSGEIEQYEELSEQGEYSVKFLILLAKLLMIQEKTNLETAYMFKNLLDALRSGQDIFKIVSIATHRGR